MSTTTVSVVISTIDRPSLARAIDNVTAQDFDGSVEVMPTRLRTRFPLTWPLAVIGLSGSGAFAFRRAKPWRPSGNRRVGRLP
jgi:hypothetical protein